MQPHFQRLIFTALSCVLDHADLLAVNFVYSHVNSLATLIHAFVTSRIDYCNSLLAAVPKYTTDKLQRVLVAAARVITSTRKYDRGLSRLLHEKLHWLDVPERILFKLCVIIHHHQCLNNKAPWYLMDTCSSVATVPGRQRLRSARRNYLMVPRHRLATYGRRAVVIGGPSAWNDLLDELRDISLSRTVFRSHLKTYFFSSTSALSALEVFHYNALYKFMFTITMTCYRSYL